MANAQENPTLAQGTDFFILIEDQGGVTFQHALNRTFTIEVLSGTFNGSDCTLSMNRRGGSLYFVSGSTAQVSLFQYSDGDYTAWTHFDDTMVLNVDGMEVDEVTRGFNWNGTIPASGEVYIRWSWNLLMPHEWDFMFAIGIAGLIMLVIGIALFVYCLRKYKIFTLGDEETVWEKDALMIAVVLIILGLCLIFAWFFSGGG